MPSQTASSQTLEKSGKKLAADARKLERSTERIEDSADRRTRLAADRTLFAAERTYAAWVRTGLFSLASGVGARQLLTGLIWEWLIVATGSVMVLFSAFCFIAGVWRHLEPGPPPPHPHVRQVPAYLLVIFSGFLTLVALAVLVAIWFGPPRG